MSVGVLRAADQDSAVLAGALAVLTVTLAMAAGLSSWQHASVGCEVIDHLQRAEEVAAKQWRRAARARVLRRYDGLGATLDVRWRAAEERGGGRIRLARARCAFFRARHARVFGHGVRLPGEPGHLHLPTGDGWVTATGHGSGPAEDDLATAVNGASPNGNGNGGDGSSTLSGSGVKTARRRR